jgi:hypothetical protein
MSLYNLQASNVPAPEILNDGVWRFQSVAPEADPDILWLVLTYDETSWGRERGFLGGKRSVEDFLQMVTDTDLDLANVSLGLLTSSPGEFNHFIGAAGRLPFARLTIFLHPGFNQEAVSDRDHRHDDDFQTVRRAELAQLRNYLMLSGLNKERHVIWLDADVYHLDQGIIQRVIAHSETRADVGIITARCEAPWGPNYDLNAWAGPHKHAKVVDQLVEGTQDDDLIPLTAVGGTFLYIRASLVRRGVSFPYYYAVNTKWNEDGDDGIETEGMCYQTRGLKEGGCFVMGGSWHTKHGE